MAKGLIKQAGAKAVEGVLNRQARTGGFLNIRYGFSPC